MIISLSPGARADQLDDKALFKFLMENKDKFPLIELGRGEPPLAKIHTMKAQAVPLKFGGRFYNGFRFDTPEWQDGEVIWAHARTPKPGVAPSNYLWSILPDEPVKDRSGTFLSSYSLEIGEKFPYAKKAFPGSTGFRLQVFTRDIVKPGGRYIMWFSFEDEVRTEANFAITMNSVKGVAEWGMLPTGPSARGPNEAYASIPPTPKKDPRITGKEAVEIFKKSGPAAAEAFLNKEVENHIRSGASYEQFHFHIWKAVQDGEIRTNLEWGAFGFDWLQRTGSRLGAKYNVEGLCFNTAVSFMAVRKPGAARQALEPWFKGMAERELPVDPLELEDKGPFLKELPMIRRRSSLIVKRTQATVIAPCGMIERMPDLPVGSEASLKAIADLEASGGDWKRAIERNLCVRDLAEDLNRRVFEREDQWYGAMQNIVEILQSIGLGESALAVVDEFQANKAKERYRNRAHMKVRLLALDIRIDLGQAEKAMLAQLDGLYKEISGNPNLGKSAWESVLITKAKCLAALGRATEADVLLTRLAEVEDNDVARIERIAQRIAADRLDGIENELLTALANRRDWGLKMDEVRLYSLYADFLEKSGRIGEAITSRREAVRLQRSFDLFALLPVELARLTAMLQRCGDFAGAEVVAKEAGEIAALPYQPDRVAKQVRSLLAVVSKSTIAADVNTKTTLQPREALVIPISGKPICGRMTITNPGNRRAYGRVSFSGMPVAAVWDGITVTATIGKTGTPAVNVSVDPGSYVLIDLDSGVPSPQGKLEVTWSIAGQPDQTSRWTFEPGETDVPAAVIDAGVYRRNAFFGVPVFHHYQHASPDAVSASLRVVSTPGCRVELYDGSNRPISIDVNGDGEFTGVGDDYFHDPDGDGRVDFPLEKGNGVIRIQAFPPAELPAEGLKLQLQSWTGTEWSVVAESRIEP